MSVIDKIKKRMLYSIIFGIFVIIVLLIYADVGKLTEAFLQFNWIYIPVIVLLTLLNYVFRFYKWDYYLGKIDIHIPKKDSFIVFFSGLVMSITPGKLGEVFKSYLLKQLDDIEISRSAPIIFAERLTDVMGLLILASVGIIVYDYGLNLLMAILAIFALIVLIIQSRTLSMRIIDFCERLPLVSNFVHHLRLSYESAYTLLRHKPLFYTIAISIVSWFFECIAMWYVLKGFGLDRTLLESTFVFAFSSLAGAVSMLPGGLGVAEGSIVGLLHTLDVSNAIATGTALIIRFGTLWFGVLLGIVVLSLNVHKFQNS